jgi:hypothetical protein
MTSGCRCPATRAVMADGHDDRSAAASFLQLIRSVEQRGLIAAAKRSTISHVIASNCAKRASSAVDHGGQQ